jgi:coenzyme F420 hydrogenase subunit beta
MKKSIEQTVKNSLCTGCGLCEDVCPFSAISIKRGVENTPVVNHEKCVECGKCLKVCPGIGCELNRLAKASFPDENTVHDRYIGYYLETYIGYSNNYEIRFHGASGGILSQFLIYLLEKKVIQGAVVTRFSLNSPMKPEPFIATTREEILSARSSKYCPVSLNGMTKKILDFEGKVVVVGLPCHIQSLRKRLEFDRKLKEKIVGLFSIYCSSNRNFNAQEFLLNYYGIHRDDVKKFAYRDDGCLGNMKLYTSPSSPLLDIPFIDYYGALRSFFKPRRCLSCIDHYGELADVNFGDIHIAPYTEDAVGISSVVVRSSDYQRLLLQAADEGVLHLETINHTIVNESQKEMLYPKQRRVKAIMSMDRLLFRKTAVYDKELDKPRLKDYISEVLCNCQRFVGKHPSLWFIIRYVFSKKIPKEFRR